MILENQNEIDKLEKQARIKFIFMLIFLFVLCILSILIFIDGEFGDLISDVRALPLRYYIPIITIIIPVALSFSNAILFVKSLDIFNEHEQNTQDRIEKKTIFTDVIGELQKPSTQRIKRRKKVIVSLFVLTIITLVATRSYIMVIYLVLL
ncbi:MAG: hypothetical protein FK733_07180 [Asgard group archaeon]|nr:hypothetical protein [Asgard group archaeon]